MDRCYWKVKCLGSTVMSRAIVHSSMKGYDSD